MYCSAVLNTIDENGWFWEQARAASSPLHSRMGGNKPLVVFELWYHPGDQTETTAPLGMSLSQHTPEDEQGKVKTFALEERHQSQDPTRPCRPRLLQYKEIQGWLSQAVSTRLASPRRSAAESGAEACFSAHSSGACRHLQVRRSELILGKGDRWTSDGRRAMACHCSQILMFMEKQHPIWLSNPGQFPCKKGKEAGKKELPFLKCLL